MIQKPYTIAEIKAKVASNDYSAELMLQHAMLHLDALAAQPAAEPDCEHCGGTGEVLAHAENCLNELCALNGDEHSCAGHVEPCSCAAQPTRAGGDAPFDEDACRERCNVCWGDGSFSTCERKRLHEAAALAAAPQPAAADPANTWGYERQRALMEANRNEAADLWDKGMPMTEQDRRFFEYGFDSGWTRGRAVKSVEQPAASTDEEIEALAVARYKVVPAHSSMFWSHAVVAGDGQQQLYVGREVECQNMARKFAGAFLDGAFVAQQPAASTVPASSSALVLKPMQTADGRPGWYVDAPEFFLDVEKGEDGRWSVFMRDNAKRETFQHAATAAVERDAYRVFKDGAQWCAVGPAFVNLQESPAGFADTPCLALEQLCKTEGTAS